MRLIGMFDNPNGLKSHVYLTKEGDIKVEWNVGGNYPVFGAAESISQIKQYESNGDKVAHEILEIYRGKWLPNKS